MAKVNWGGGQQVSGKVGGVVYTKNGQMRKKSQPTNKRTQAQFDTKASFSGNAQNWKNLTEAQRTAWLSTSSNFSTKDAFGNTLQLKGITLYNRLNNNLDLIGQPAIDVPPNPQGGGYAPVITPTITVTGNIFSLAYDPSPIGTAQSVVVWASTGYSAGKKFVANSLKVIAVLEDGDITPADLFTAYTDVFGSLIAGSTVYVQVQSYNDLTGETGSVQLASAVVGA